MFASNLIEHVRGMLDVVVVTDAEHEVHTTNILSGVVDDSVASRDSRVAPGAYP